MSKKVEKYVIISYMVVVCGVLGSIGAVDAGNITFLQAAIQILGCLSLGLITHKIQKRYK